MNAKLQKIIREIEHAKTKIEELQASLPALEKQKTELENTEIIKIFRTANVTPADFTAFVAAYKTKESGNAPLPERSAPQPNTMEDQYNEED